jgi:dsDNA-specific endonuclease/ATPase MutS2
MGLAISILEALYNSGAMIVATTHYSEIKEFAEKASGFQNGSMDFDIETLQPLYKLIVGKGGESQAFSIAQKLGMPASIINRAKEISYDQPKGEYNITPATFNRDNRNSQKKKAIPKDNLSKNTYQIGDAVWISQLQTKGIVVSTPNSMGEMELLVKGQKMTLNHKRVKPFIDAEELYPEEYDLNQVFDAKDVRKKKKMMDRKHVEGLTIDHNEE